MVGPEPRLGDQEDEVWAYAVDDQVCPPVAGGDDPQSKPPATRPRPDLLFGGMSKEAGGYATGVVPRYQGGSTVVECAYQPLLADLDGNPSVSMWPDGDAMDPSVVMSREIEAISAAKPGGAPRAEMTRLDAGKVPARRHDTVPPTIQPGLPGHRRAGVFTNRAPMRHASNVRPGKAGFQGIDR